MPLFIKFCILFTLSMTSSLANISSVKITYTPPKSIPANTPRVYLAITNSRGEPRSLISNWFNLPHLYAVDDTDRDGKVSFDDKAPGSKVPLNKLEKGTYSAQVVVRINNDWGMPGKGLGDLYSPIQKITIDPDTPLNLTFTASKSVAPPTFRTEGQIRDAYFHSKQLSQFHERPVNMRYTVMLPENWNPKKEYPLVVYVFGFAGIHNLDTYVKRELGEGVKDVITLIPDANCYWGHSVFADSEVNGPWATALTKELIPFVEKTYGGLGVKHRYVTGTSSGGWSSLWLKVRYPEQFNSCWSCAPDPLNFSEFLQVDLYKDLSLYKKADGDTTPMTIQLGFRKPLTFEDFGNYEKILGAGGQLKSFAASFSKRLDDGSPQPWFDIHTGKIDLDVIKSWKNYEISSLIKKQWPLHKKYLAGKIHLSVHEQDVFFLDQSVRSFEKTCNEINCDATFHYAPGIGHHITPPFAKAMFDQIKKDLESAKKVTTTP